MENEEVRDKITEFFNNIQKPQTRSIVLHTGVGGYDLFETAIEKELGFERIVIGKKVPRILRRLKFTIKQSPVGYYYKLVKIKK